HLFINFIVTAAHETLDRINRILSVRHRLPLRDLSNQTLTAFCKSNDGRSCAASFLVCNDDRFSTLHDCDDGVGGPQVDSYDFAHREFPPAGCLNGYRLMIPELNIRSEWSIVNTAL